MPGAIRTIANVDLRQLSRKSQNVMKTGRRKKQKKKTHTHTHPMPLSKKLIVPVALSARRKWADG
jgi:hypothetical protein